MSPPTRWILALAGVSLLAGLLVAQGWSPAGNEPRSLEARGLQGGDRLVYREAVSTPNGEHRYGVTLQVGALAGAADRYGRSRPVHPIHLQRVQGKDIVSDETCRSPVRPGQGALRSIDEGQAGVRPPTALSWTLANGPDPWLPSWARADVGVWSEAHPDLAHRDTPCWGATELATRSLSTGDRVRVSHLWPRPPDPLVPHGTHSEPAHRDRFMGRPALAFPFAFETTLQGPAGRPVDVSVEGRALMAHGLPAPARLQISVEPAPGGLAPFTWTWTLTRFQAGHGAPLRPDLSGLPDESDDGSTVELGRQGPARGPGTLAYPLEEAVDAVLSDPTVGASMFLERYPGAYLSSAVYQRDLLPGPGHDRGSPGQGDVVTDGGWWLTFSKGDKHCVVKTVRVHRAAGPEEPLASRTTVNNHRVSRGPGNATELQVAPPIETLPRQVAAPSLVRGALEAGGLDPTGLERFEYHVRNTTEGGRAVLRYRATNAAAYPESGSPTRARDVLIDSRSGGLVAARSPGDPGADRMPPPSKVEPQAAGTVAPVGGPVGWGIAAALAVLVLPPLWRRVLAPILTGLTREEVLEHEVRCGLYREIQDQPGVHLSSLVQSAGVGEGATRHHLRKLVEHGLVDRFEHGGYTRFYPGDYPADEREEVAVLRSGCNREVYRLLDRDPDMSIREIADRMGRAPSTVHRAVGMLREVGLLPGGEDDGGRSGDGT